MIYIIVSIVAIVVISLVIISWQHDNPMKKSQKLDKENLQSHWKEIIGKAKDRPPRETMLAADELFRKAVGARNDSTAELSKCLRSIKSISEPEKVIAATKQCSKLRLNKKKKVEIKKAIETCAVFRQASREVIND
jgi:hypothetical protein